MQAVSRIIILLMDIKNKSSAKQNSRAERGRFCDEFLLRECASRPEGFYFTEIPTEFSVK